MSEACTKRLYRARWHQVLNWRGADMKTGRILCAAVVALSVGVLGACSGSKSPEELKAAGAKQWTGEEILAAYEGNSAYTSGYNGTSKWEWAGYYRPDGTASGRAWWSGGEAIGSGKWKVEGAQLCSEWPDRKEWGGGVLNCFEVFQEGAKVMQIGVSGPDKGRTFEMKFQAGNAYEL